MVMKEHYYGFCVYFSKQGKLIEFTLHYDLSSFNKNDWLEIKDVLNIYLFKPPYRSYPTHVDISHQVNSI